MSCSSFAVSSMWNPAITPIKTVKLISLSSTAPKSSPWRPKAARINPHLPLRSISPTVSRSTPCATPSGVTGKMDPSPIFHCTWPGRQKNFFDKAAPHTRCEELPIWYLISQAPHCIIYLESESDVIPICPQLQL